MIRTGVGIGIPQQFGSEKSTPKSKDTEDGFTASAKEKNPINYQRLALRMSKAKTIREALGIYKKAVGK